MLQILRHIVAEAGDLVAPSFGNPTTIETKKDGSFVTDVDITCEDFLKKKLHRLLPKAGFLAEESEVEVIPDWSGYNWVIDPLDGTKNFINGNPYFGISVSLMKNYEIVAAVTYAPLLNDMMWADVTGMHYHFQAVQNKKNMISVAMGSFWNHQSEVEQRYILDHLISSDIPQRSVDIQVRGSVTLDLMYIAAGYFQAGYYRQAHWWDIAAGTLFAKSVGLEMRSSLIEPSPLRFQLQQDCVISRSLKINDIDDLIKVR